MTAIHTSSLSRVLACEGALDCIEALDCSEGLDLSELLVALDVALRLDESELDASRASVSP